MGDWSQEAFAMPAIVNAHHNVPGGEVGSRSAEAPVNEQRPPRQGTA